MWETASSTEVRGPEGAMVCESRDLGIGFPSWRALLFEEGVIVDMKTLCPQDEREKVCGEQMGNEKSVNN